MKIQWYPGHMAKSKRLLITQLKVCDFIIELCDARIPYSSRNPELLKLSQNKKRVVILTKSDLANPSQTEKWLNHFKNNGEIACAYDSQTKSVKKIKDFIEYASLEYIERAQKRGIKRIIRAMVIGVPNVGKSTFINRMCGRQITEVADRPGVTQSNRWVKVNPYFELLDTPGMLWPRIDDEYSAQKLAYIGTIKDAVYNIEELSILLLRELLAVNPKETIARFKIGNPTVETDIELLDEICKGRGFLLKGGIYDYERCCSVILDEFRSAKVARVTLESPEEFLSE